MQNPLRQIIRYMVSNAVVTMGAICGIFFVLNHMFGLTGMIVGLVAQIQPQELAGVPAMANNTGKILPNECCDVLLDWDFDERLVKAAKAVLENKDRHTVEGAFLELEPTESGDCCECQPRTGFLWRGVLLIPDPLTVDEMMYGRHGFHTTMRIHSCITTGENHDSMVQKWEAKERIVPSHAFDRNGTELTHDLDRCYPLMDALKKSDLHVNLNVLFLGTKNSVGPMDMIVKSLPLDLINIEIIAIVGPRTASSIADMTAVERAKNYMRGYGYTMVEKSHDEVLFSNKVRIISY